MDLVPAHLSTNTVLELLVLVYLLTDIATLIRPGMMRYQLEQIFETRSERSFGRSKSISFYFYVFFLLQFFLFVGLHLFLLITTDTAAERLEHPTSDEWLLLGICMCIPLVWEIIQIILYIWWTTVFGLSRKIQILNRVYTALHFVFSPCVMLVFMLEMIGLIEIDSATVLLTLFFILLQIAFIFSGIKIFWGGLSAVCFLFLYLCALEIAPFAMIYQILTR